MEVQCFKRAAVHNLQCEMMQTDVRILDLPERHDAVSVRHKRRRITFVLTNNPSAKAFADEMPRVREVFHGKPHVIDADCQRDIILHCNVLALARVYEPRR